MTLVAVVTRKRLVVHLVGNPAEVARVFTTNWKARAAHKFFYITTTFATRRADSVFFVDPALADIYASPRIRAANPSRAFQKRNVDLRALSWADQPRTAFGTPLVIVAAGSQERDYKGHDLLIEACSQLVKRGLDVRLRLIGDGRLNASLRKLAVERGIPDRVEFLGHLPGTAAVQAEISACDLFVQPSRTEGFPRALVEAMATGVPCLATDVGAVASVLPANLLIARPSVEAIRSSIELLAIDPGRLSAAASSCLAAALAFREEQETEDARFARILTQRSAEG